MEAVLESQMQLQELFLKKMDAFQTRLEGSSTPASDDNQQALADEFAEFRAFVLAAIKSLQEQIYLLAKEADAQEMRARLKILLIHGVPEKNGQDLSAAVTDVIAKQLKVSDFKADHISRCNRMGRTSTTGKPRPILVKLRDISMKHTIWLAKTALKGTGVTVSEFLTKSRHDAFMMARQRFGINKCWTRDGFVFVLAADGKRHRITSLAELNKLDAPAAAAAAVVAPKVVPPKLKKPSASSKAKETRERRAITK